MNTNNNNIAIPKSESWKMFDKISKHYDLLNRLLSFGIDKYWRKVLARLISLKNTRNVLDLASGTGDVLITIAKNRPELAAGVGIDMSLKMLEIGTSKIEKLGLNKILSLSKGDANIIDFFDNTFENVTIAFGIRNVEDPLVVLKEMHRVSNSHAFILEFSLPKNKVIRKMHLYYLRHMVPFIGGIISAERKAYRYLNQTIEAFPYGEEFLKLMSEAKFKNCQAHPLLFGVATIYVGEK